jgi:hypothetical protein
MLGQFLWNFLAPLALVGGILAVLDRRQGLGIGTYLRADRERAIVYGATAAVVLVATGVTFAVGNPPELERYGGLKLYYVAWVLFLAGAVLTPYAARHYGLATALRDAETVAPDDLPADGHVVVSGAAEPVADRRVVDGPDGETALFVERGTGVGLAAADGTPDTTRAQVLAAPDRRAVPFDLVGEYGQVRVDPTDARSGFLDGTLDGDEIVRTIAPGEAVTALVRAENGTVTETLAVARQGNPNLGRFARNVPRLVWLGPGLAAVGYVGMLLAAGAL